MLYFICKPRSQSLDEERRDTESMLLEVQCEVSSHWWFGVPCHLLVLVHCVFWSPQSTIIYQDILDHSILPSADMLYGDADFIFQQDLAHCQRYQKLVQWPCVTVLDWPANSPDLNPENLDERHQTQQSDDLKNAIKATWASLHLSSATDWSTPYHAALMQSFMQKEAQPCIECIQMNILFRSLTFLFKISFFYIM